MIIVSRNLLLMITLCISMASAAEQISSTNQDEIATLIGLVRSSDCTFIRNGKRYDSDSAAKHMQRKYDYALGKYDDITAEQFIEHIASKSSWSGKDYTLECPPDNIEQRSTDWLTERLTAQRQKVD